MKLNTIPPGQRSAFYRYVRMTAALFVILAIAFAVYAWSEKQIDRAEELLDHIQTLLHSHLGLANGSLSRVPVLLEVVIDVDES